jgi:small subunit ribosomal protein S10
MAKGKQFKSKLRLKLKSYDIASIDKSAKSIVEVAIRTGALIAGPVPLPTKTEIFSYPRAAFIDKRSFEQFERRTHQRIVDILDPTPNTISELYNLKLPTGVEINIKS